MHNRPLPVRKVTRKRDWDYRSPAAYFITISTSLQQRHFGHSKDGKMILSPFGQIAHDTWVRGGDIIPNILTLAEESIIMPDHMHAIAWILDENDPHQRDPRKLCFRSLNRLDQHDYPKNRQHSLGAIIGSYKSTTTRQIHELCGNSNLKVWHRGFHDIIIPNTRALYAIRAYIRNNPIRSMRRYA